MSFDAFEARLAFLKLLRTLNASQQSIQKVVAYATKYGARCGEDLWECVVEQCGKGTLNARINLLYMLDSLLETSAAHGPPDAPYVALVERSLPRIVDDVVPAGEGQLNVRSARQILESWRTRRLIDPAVLDAALHTLDGRKPDDGETRKRPLAMSRQEVVQRIEEDRERQKRLRERVWVLPIPSLAPAQPTANPSPASPFTPASPSSAGRTPRTPRDHAHPHPHTHPLAATASTSASAPASASALAPASALVPVPAAAAAVPPHVKREMPPPPVPDADDGGRAEPGRDRDGGRDGHANANADGRAPLEVEFEQLWESTSELGDDDFQAMARNAKLAQA
ncbi:hypothetical protein Q5752_002932 [Cryptotrichosporon argae]